MFLSRRLFASAGSPAFSVPPKMAGIHSGDLFPEPHSIRVPAMRAGIWCRKSSAVIWIVRQEVPWKKRMSNTDFSVPFFFRPEEKARKSCRPVSSAAAASMSSMSGAGEQWAVNPAVNMSYISEVQMRHS